MSKPKPEAVTLACAQCSTPFTRSVSHVRSQQERGQRRFYCTPTCARQAARAEQHGFRGLPIIRRPRPDPSTDGVAW